MARCWNKMNFKVPPNSAHSKFLFCLSFAAGGNQDGKFSIGFRDGVVRTVVSLDRETVASYTLILEAIGKDFPGFSWDYCHQATPGGPGHIQLPCRCVRGAATSSTNQSLCLVLTFHSPCELICPGFIMTFAEGVFSSQVCPAPGLSLSPGKEGPPYS